MSTNAGTIPNTEGMNAEQLLALLGQINSKRDQMLSELEAKRAEVLTKIKDVDNHRVRLTAALTEVDDQMRSLGVTPPPQPRPQEAAKWCPICNMAGHDRRAHRGQAVARPFTPAELSSMGYTPAAQAAAKGEPAPELPKAA